MGHNDDGALKGRQESVGMPSTHVSLHYRIVFSMNRATDHRRTMALGTARLLRTSTTASKRSKKNM